MMQIQQITIGMLEMCPAHLQEQMPHTFQTQVEQLGHIRLQLFQLLIFTAT